MNNITVIQLVCPFETGCRHPLPLFGFAVPSLCLTVSLISFPLQPIFSSLCFDSFIAVACGSKIETFWCFFLPLHISLLYI